MGPRVFATAFRTPSTAAAHHSMCHDAVHGSKTSSSTRLHQRPVWKRGAVKGQRWWLPKGGQGHSDGIEAGRSPTAARQRGPVPWAARWFFTDHNNVSLKPCCGIWGGGGDWGQGASNPIAKNCGKLRAVRKLRTPIPSPPPPVVVCSTRHMTSSGRGKRGSRPIFVAAQPTRH